MLFALAMALTVPAAAQEAGFDKLVFREEFDGYRHELLRRWSLGLWFHAGLVRKEDVALKDGVVRITAQAAPAHRNTMLSSWSANGKIRRTYGFGYFEARMRWPNRESNWANFWLESEKAAQQPFNAKWPPFCEIDIVEAIRPGYQAVVHDWTSRTTQTIVNILTRRRVAVKDPEVWHTYAVLWRKGSIEFFFDGKRVTKAVSPQVCDEQRMMVNFGSQRRRDSSEYAEFDWVRIWGPSQQGD